MANPKIVQGQTATLVIQLIDQDTKKPYPLIGHTLSVGYFPAATGGAYPATGSLVSADLGTIQIEFDETMTPNLAPGDDQSYEIVSDLGPTRLIAQFEAALDVKPRFFP